jgi:Protein of unknown function (DUF1097).
MASALATGLLCGLWSLLAPLFRMLTWAGFAGCTTFFAIGEGGTKSAGKAILCNLTGVACGLFCIWLSEVVNIPYSAAIFSGIITIVMCLLGQLHLINYTPGIFIGCFSTFAANGHVIALLLSLICGAFLGYSCDELGKAFTAYQQNHLSHAQKKKAS